MKAIILAAGKGTRLGEMGKEIPKCLIEINGKTLLEQKIRFLEELGIKEIITIIGGHGECWTKENIDRITNISKKVLVNERNDETSNTYSARIGLEVLPAEDLVIIDGDLVISFETLKNIVNDKRNLILSKKSNNPYEKRNKILSEKEKVLKMGKEIPFQELKFPYDIYGACFKIRKEDFEKVKETIQKEEYITKNTDQLVSELCQKMDLYHFSDEKWININKIEDLEEAKKLFQKRKNFVVIMNGYTATGKSTIARKISQIPNTRIFQSANIRKDLGLSPKTLEEADKLFDYQNKKREYMDKKVYQKISENLKNSLMVGKNVVLDAGYFFKWQRNMVYETSKEFNPEIFLVRIKCNDENEIKKRLEGRKKDFGIEPTAETPSWNTYLATKKITEDIEDDEKGAGLEIIEYDTLTNSFKTIPSPNSENLKVIIEAIKENEK